MQDALTITFEAIVLSFLALMIYDFVRNFPPPPSHPRAEMPSLLDDSPEVTDPWFEPLPEVAVIRGKQEPEPKAQLLLLPAVFPRETKQWMRADELMAESIRSLKKRAAEARVKKYSSMTKAELVEALLRT